MSKLPLSRRRFLGNLVQFIARTTSLASLSNIVSNFETKANAEQISKTYKISPWTGDDFTLGHQLRSQIIPNFSIDTEKEVDFVIVGGGVAGLTTAYYLRGENFLLLEQYDHLGGESIGGSYQGIDYSMGAAYIGQAEGIYGELFSELGINPVEIEKDKNAWHMSDNENNNWILDNGTSEFKRLIEEAEPIWKVIGKDVSKEAVLSDELSKLDKMPFANCMKGYSPAFMSLIDNYLKSSCCGGINNLSALAAYSVLSEFVEPISVFEGGNSAIPKALVKAINKAGLRRLLPGAFVWRIDLKENGASIIYGLKDGGYHRVNCRHVIVCTPPFITYRIMPKLDDQMKACLMPFKYGSYLVANFLLKKKIFDHAYDNYVDNKFSFADFIVAETPYQYHGKYNQSMGSVLTVYQPYVPGSEGRTLLFAGDKQYFSKSLFAQMSQLAEHLDKYLEEIVLTRWGHAMVVAQPGFFNQIYKIKTIQEKNQSYTLAHNSMQGLPCAESAIRAAKYAAKRVKG